MFSALPYGSEFHMIQKEDQKREAQKKLQDMQYKYNELERDFEEIKSSTKSMQASQDSSFLEVSFFFYFYHFC